MGFYQHWNNDALNCNIHKNEQKFKKCAFKTVPSKFLRKLHVAVFEKTGKMPDLQIQDVDASLVRL